MNRSIKVERLYSLGDYKNIKFIDEITDLPEDIATDEEMVGKLSYLQLVGIEKSFYRYYELAKKVKTLNPEEILGFLEEERESILGQLFFDKKGENKNAI